MPTPAELALEPHRPRARGARATCSACSGAGASWPTSPSPTCCSLVPVTPAEAGRAVDERGSRAGRPGPDAPEQPAHPGRPGPGGPDGQRVAVDAGGPVPAHAARSCAGASTTRSWASRSRSRTSRSASRARIIAVAAPGVAGARSRGRRACTSAPTSTCSSAWPTWWPSRPSRSPTRTSAPRRRPGWATAWWWSTPTGRVEFASPNAMNAFHRMGIYAQPEGRRFGDLDIEESAVEWALATGRPVVEEVERRPDVIVLRPLHPAAVARRGHRGHDPAARRHRRPAPRPAAAVQGRRHPRGAPPGQEQPADDLVAAAASRPAGWATGRPGWRCTRPSAGCAPSRSCTRSCRATRATRCPSPRSWARWSRWPRTRWSRRSRS